MDKHVSHCYTDGQLTEAIERFRYPLRLNGEMDASGNDKMRYHLTTCGDCYERMRENVARWQRAKFQADEVLPHLKDAWNHSWTKVERDFFLDWLTDGEEG